ncbi:MAG: RNA-binding domain-containing protein [Candidatus Bathyarchaeia archaeon]|jgi:RNA binding exosome subunit
MSSHFPIGYIDIRVFAHATEDTAKVEAATKNLFPLSLSETLVFSKTTLSGHHSNPIVLFTAQLTDRKLLPSALAKLGADLSTLDKEQLNQDIKLHLEKGNLYLRFDKQAAYLGAAKLTQNDPIHVKIHFKNKTQQEIVELAKQSGLLP